MRYFDNTDLDIQPLLLQGNFGLERESLRVTGDGRLAQTPHPFTYHRQITRDFCESSSGRRRFALSAVPS